MKKFFGLTVLITSLLMTSSVLSQSLFMKDGQNGYGFTLEFQSYNNNDAFGASASLSFYSRLDLGIGYVKSDYFEDIGTSVEAFLLKATDKQPFSLSGSSSIIIENSDFSSGSENFYSFGGNLYIRLKLADTFFAFPYLKGRHANGFDKDLYSKNSVTYGMTLDAVDIKGYHFLFNFSMTSHEEIKDKSYSFGIGFVLPK